MTTKNIIISSAVALSMLALGTVALANTSMLNQKAVAIDGSGNVALAGTVSAVSGSTISVNSWLGTWTVNNVTLTNVQVGDTVKVAGTLGSGMTVSANAVKDFTQISAMENDNANVHANSNARFHLNIGAWFKNWFKR